MKRHRELEPAYHEAGHAVMEMLGCYYKRTPRVVSIVPDRRDSTRGHVTSRDLTRGTVEALEWMGDIRAERRLRDLLMVSLAGEAAARIKMGRATGLGGDRKKQGDLILRLAKDQVDQRAWWMLLWNQTKRTLQYYWPAVEALAQALLERKRIPGREARSIALDAQDRAVGGERLVQARRQLEQSAARLRKAKS